MPAPVTAPKTVQQAEPSVYYLKDKDGNLVPVLGFAYEDFKEMVERKARSEQPEPSPRYSLQGLLIQGSARGDQAELKVELTIRVLADNWVRVPLRMDQAVLRNPPQYQGPGQHFLHFEEGAGYVSWIRGGVNQDHRVTLDILVPLTAAGPETRLRLFLPRAANSELKLSTPAAGVVARVSEGARLLPAAKPGDSSQLHAVGLGGDFELAWRAGADAPAPAPPVLEAVGAVLARVDGQGITFDAKLTVRSYSGPFDHVRVRLPKGAQLVPGNASSYTVTPVALGGPTGEDWKVAEVRFPGKTTGPEEVRLSSRVEYDVGSAGWSELAGYEVIGADRQWGYLAISAGSDWHVLLGPNRGVRQVDELPESLNPRNLAAAFEYFMQPCSLAARVVPRTTRIAVEPEYVFLVEAGQVTMQSRLKYTVRTKKIRTLDIDMGEWQLDEVGPENLVAVDSVVDNPPGPLSITLKQESIGQIELTLRARRKLPPGAKSLSIELPRLRAPADATILQSPSAVVVLPDDNVELTPSDGATTGLVRQHGAPAMKLPPRRQEPLFYRGEPGKAVFAAEFRVRSRAVRVAAASEVRLDEQKAQVEQKFSYAIAYEPVDRLALDVPRDLAVSDQVEIRLDDGKRLTPVDARPEEPSDPAQPQRKLVALPSPRIGPCELVVRYSVELDKLQPQASITSTIPLVMPADGELTGNQAVVVSNEGIRAQARAGPWTASEAETGGARRRGLELSAAGRTAELALAIYLEDQAALGSTVVDRAWIQTWLTSDVREDRAVFRFTSNQKHVEVVVPAGVDPGDVELWLDDKRINGQATPEGHVIVALPAGAASSRRRLEAIYRFPTGRSEPGLLAIELPRLGRDAWVHRTYWQLVLPPKEHVVMSPAPFTQEYRWGWNGFFWGRQALLDQSALEAWCGARRLTDLPEQTNRYLYSGMGTVARCEIRTARRPLIVLAASGLALVAGLLLIYARALRHPLCLATAAVALSWALIVHPELTLLGAQAAGLGIVLAAGAGLLQRGVNRQRRGAARETSSSILDRGSTRSVPPIPAPGNLESTEVAPAQLPNPLA